MFLPAANLAIAGLVFAFAIEGFSGASQYLYNWANMPVDTWSAVRDSLVDYSPK
jgi:hypothetical protein